MMEIFLSWKGHEIHGWIDLPKLILLYSKVSPGILWYINFTLKKSENKNSINNEIEEYAILWR